MDDIRNSNPSVVSGCVFIFRLKVFIYLCNG